MPKTLKTAAAVGGAAMAPGLIGAQIAGNAMGAGASLWAQKKQNRFNHNEAELNRNFMKQMSDTSVSRKMNDLQNAGVNPLLAVNSGQGATAYSGSQASASAGNPLSHMAPDIMGAITGAQAMSESRERTRQLEKLAEMQRTQALLNRTKGTNLSQQTKNLQTQRLKLISERRGQQINNILNNSRVAQAKNLSTYHKSKFGKYADYANEGNKTVGGLLDSFGKLKDIIFRKLNTHYNYNKRIR